MHVEEGEMSTTSIRSRSNSFYNVHATSGRSNESLSHEPPDDKQMRTSVKSVNNIHKRKFEIGDCLADIQSWMPPN